MPESTFSKNLQFFLKAQKLLSGKISSLDVRDNTSVWRDGLRDGLFWTRIHITLVRNLAP